MHTTSAAIGAVQPFIAAVHTAIERAGRPLPTLSSNGPGTLPSDFGNNTGVVIGPALPACSGRDGAGWLSETAVKGDLAGSGNAGRMRSGLLAALLFLANDLFARGLTLRPGDWVSTGASTGIHVLAVGDTVAARFDGKPAITLPVCAAQPAR